MLQALARALLIIFGYPLLPKNLVVADPSTFQERLDMKRKENIMWLIVWYCVTCLFLWLFGHNVNYILVTVVFVFLGIFCIEPKASLLFFSAVLILEHMWAMYIIVGVAGYIVFFWILAQLSYDSSS